MKAVLYEIEYSCSPGGIDQWALEIKLGLGHSEYNEFNTPSKAIKYLIDKYGDKEIELNIQSLRSIEHMEYDFV